MEKESNKVKSPSSPTWKNWSGNLVHNPPSDGSNYYFTPSNQADLKSVLVEANKEGMKVRVSGQRHSQPPLVIDDNRDTNETKPNEYLIDMSCYTDLGSNMDQRMLLGPAKNQVTVNAGVREDDLDAFLTSNKLMFKTVTAGGFFSIGGMVAVDVHGATIDSSIFAEDVSEFNIMLADGSIQTINSNSPQFNFGNDNKSWMPLQFARVSLGGLGIVTSVIINVQERKSANSLQGTVKRLSIFSKDDFAATFKKLLKDQTRVETFFTPYAASVRLSNFLTLSWKVYDKNDGSEVNNPTAPETACQLAGKNPPEFGAPYLGFIGDIGAYLAEEAQYYSWPFTPPAGPAEITAIARDTIEKDGKKANLAHSELWLNGAVAVIFMSYFIPIENLEEEGLGKVWDSLDLVTKRVLKFGKFHISAPMEFRFVKGGNSSMSGAYTEEDNTWFVNQDLIGFVKPNLKASEYPEKLLNFFADVERDWVNMGGFPHNGKMYGFYDPKEPKGSYSKSGPFNKNFLSELRKRRGIRLEAYNAYRKKLDPKGIFYNKYLNNLLEE